MKNCLFLILFTAFSLNLFSETIKKTIPIDSLYKIERIYDDENKTLDLNLISSNSVPFDEQYAESCIHEALTNFINDHTELQCAELQCTSLNAKHENGKNTALNKRFILVLKK